MKRKVYDEGDPFGGHTERYAQWYERHAAAYESELNAVRYFWPDSGDGLEVGTGTGHFGAPLGIQQGVEPSAPMRAIAEQRGLSVHAMLCLLGRSGFRRIETCQTLYHHPDHLTMPDPVEPGHGRGAFVVDRGYKPAEGGAPC